VSGVTVVKGRFNAIISRSKNTSCGVVFSIVSRRWFVFTWYCLFLVWNLDESGSLT
jgi:hypothetical protein